MRLIFHWITFQIIDVEDDDVGVINEYQPTNEDHIKIRSSSQSHYAVVDHYIEKKITSKTE